MKIALFGARGPIGQQIILEALVRGHHVKALTRNPQGFPIAHPNSIVAKVDVFDPASVAEALADADVAVNALGDKNPETVNAFYRDTTKALIEGVERAGNKRLLTVGGAGSLEVAAGVQLADTLDETVGYCHIPLAQREQYHLLRESTIDWTYFSPAAQIGPGRRTGAYRLGTDQLLMNDQGESYISIADYAVALLDELENPQFERRRFTAVSLSR
jgi:uncharacterized protein